MRGRQNKWGADWRFTRSSKLVIAFISAEPTYSPLSTYNLKQAEAERLAKEAAEKQAEEEAKKAELEELDCE